MKKLVWYFKRSFFLILMLLVSITLSGCAASLGALLLGIGPVLQTVGSLIGGKVGKALSAAGSSMTLMGQNAQKMANTRQQQIERNEKLIADGKPPEPVIKDNARNTLSAMTGNFRGLKTESGVDAFVDNAKKNGEILSDETNDGVRTLVTRNDKDGKLWQTNINLGTNPNARTMAPSDARGLDETIGSGERAATTQRSAMRDRRSAPALRQKSNGFFEVDESLGPGPDSAGPKGESGLDYMDQGIQVGTGRTEGPQGPQGPNGNYEESQDSGNSSASVPSDEEIKRRTAEMAKQKGWSPGQQKIYENRNLEKARQAREAQGTNSSNSSQQAQNYNEPASRPASQSSSRPAPQSNSSNIPSDQEIKRRTAEMAKQKGWSSGQQKIFERRNLERARKAREAQGQSSASQSAGQNSSSQPASNSSSGSNNSNSSSQKVNDARKRILQRSADKASGKR